MEKRNGFVEQTAFDYDLEYEFVLSLYNRYGNSQEYYDELEYAIRDRISC